MHSYWAKLKRLFKDSRGQGMTEYIIIVALIAIGTIAVITVFGNNVRGLFGASADAMAGHTGIKPTDYGVTDVDKSKQKKDIKDFAGP